MEGFPPPDELRTVFVDHDIQVTLGCRVQGAGCRVQSSGYRVGVLGAGFRVQGPWFRVQDPGFKVQGSGCRVPMSFPPCSSITTSRSERVLS